MSVDTRTDRWTLSGYDPDLVPAIDPSWTDTEDTERVAAMAAPITLAPAVDLDNGGAAANSLAYLATLGDDPIRAAGGNGPMTGQVRAVWRIRAAAGSGGAVYLRLVIRVVDAAGVHRGTVFTGESAAATDTAESRTIAGDLTAFTTADGDRLVAEIGVRFAGASSGATLYGGTWSDPYLLFLDGSTEQALPWLEVTTAVGVPDDTGAQPLPALGAPWRLDYAVGPYVGTITGDTPRDQVPIRDGLTITQTARTGDLWPSWTTETAELELSAATAADLAGLEVGAGVALAWRPDKDTAPDYGDGRDSWAVRFDGQITDVTIRPAARGAVARIVAVDYWTARLSEYRITGTFPQQSAHDRLQAIADATGEEIYAFTGDGPTVRALEVKDESAYDLVERHTAQWAEPSTLDGALTRLVPDHRAGVYRPSPAESGGNGAAGRTFENFELSRTAPAAPGAYLPAIFAVTDSPRYGGGPGGYGLVVEATGPNRSRSTVAAGVVEFSAAWTVRKGQGPNTVEILWGPDANKPNKLRVTNGETPRVTATVTTELLSKADATNAGALYLPAPDGPEPWQADTFTWLLAHDVMPWALPEPGDLVTVAGIPDAWTPLSRHWYSGTLEAVTFALEDGDPVAALTINPQRPRPMSGTAAFQVQDIPPAVTINDLNNRDTLNDYRLLKDAAI